MEEPEDSPPSSKSRRWIYATLILCGYGFFKEFKPSEPFLTPYLTDNTTKNFTKDEVNSQIYVYWPYSFLIAEIFVLLLTDIVRYKPVILVEATAYLMTRFLLIWGTNVVSMQMMQVVYGIATATEIAYFSYIYPAVSLKHYKKVTSYVRAVRLFGQAMAGIVGQILISTKAFNYLQLNYFSCASVFVACVFAILLPNLCSCSCWNGTETQKTSSRGMGTCAQAVADYIRTTTHKRLLDLKAYYSSPSLLKWSLWWALATCGYLQVGNYVQSLWKEIATSTGVSYEYNGLVEAITTLCSAFAAFTLSFMKVNWPLWGELTIGCLSLLDSAVLFIAASTKLLWLAYICHILYRTTYAFLITIASTQLAYAITHDSYALIFGINTFIALVLQSFLTLAVSDEHGLDLGIRTQFRVYSGYYYFLMLVFVSAGVYKLTSMGWGQSFRLCCRDPLSQVVTSRDRTGDLVGPETEDPERQKLIQNTDDGIKNSYSQPV